MATKEKRKRPEAGHGSLMNPPGKFKVLLTSNCKPFRKEGRTYGPGDHVWLDKDQSWAMENRKPPHGNIVENRDKPIVATVPTTADMSIQEFNALVDDDWQAARTLGKRFELKDSEGKFPRNKDLLKQAFANTKLG